MSKIFEVETSHRLIQILEVKMFHAKAVARWHGLLASAQEKMGGFSAGIGFIGSPGWVLAGGTVLGAIESAISSSNAKAGVKLLREASDFLAEVHNRGIYVPISAIDGLDAPTPDAWSHLGGGINYTMLGEEFIRVRTIDGDEMMLRWSGINSVRLS